MRIIPTICLISCLSCSLEPSVSEHASPSTVMPACDGVTDDRATLQASLDTGTLVVPAGRCLVGRGAGFCGLHAPAGATISGSGPGTSALVEGVVPGSVRLICTDGPGVTIRDLELDGNRAAQVPDEHRAGVFATAAGVTITNVASHDFTGDGLTFHSGADNVSLSNVTTYANGRSGIAFTGCSTGATIDDATSYGNAVKALHTEPGAGCSVNSVHVHRGRFETGSADWAVSIAGGGVSLSDGWTIDGATIVGGVYVIGATNATISGSTITNVGSKPAVTVYRFDDHITFSGNAISATGAPAVVEAIGTDVANLPDHVTLSGNAISTVSVGAIGVHAISARGLAVTGNTITGSSTTSPYAYGVYARSIVAGSALVFSASGNTISSWGSVGVEVADTGGGIVNSYVTGNTFSTLRYAMGGVYTQSGNTIAPGVTLFAP